MFYSGMYGIVIVMFILGFWLFWSFEKKIKKARNLAKETSTSKVRSIAVGPVELVGVSSSKNKILKSVFTNEEYIYKKTLIYQTVGKSQNLIYHDVGPTGIYLKDDTGEILINTTRVKEEFTVSFRKSYSKRKSSDRDELTKIFSELGIDADPKNGDVLVMQKGLKVDSEIAVLGYAQSHTNSDDSNLFVGHNKDVPFIITDKGEKGLRTTNSGGLIAILVLKYLFLLMTIATLVVFGLVIFIGY